MERNSQSAPDIQARRALPDDAAAVASVLRAAFLEYEAAYTPEGFAATTPACDPVLERMREGPVWVAVERGDIIGTVAAVPRGAALYIRSMAVLPVARGRNVGELLLGCAERFATAQGFTSMILSTTPFLTRAIRLYERWGFRYSDEGPTDLFGTPLVTMVMALPATGNLAFTGGESG